MWTPHPVIPEEPATERLLVIVPLLVGLGVQRLLVHVDIKYPGERAFAWQIFQETCVEFAQAMHYPLDAIAE